jgi:hypothetical protein
VNQLLIAFSLIWVDNGLTNEMIATLDQAYKAQDVDCQTMQIEARWVQLAPVDPGITVESVVQILDEVDQSQSPDEIFLDLFNKFSAFSKYNFEIYTLTIDVDREKSFNTPSPFSI